MNSATPLPYFSKHNVQILLSEHVDKSPLQGPGNRLLFADTARDEDIADFSCDPIPASEKQFVCENDINKPASHFASRGCHQAVMDLSLKGRKEWAITPTQGRRTRQQPQLEAIYFDEFICCSVP